MGLYYVIPKDEFEAIKSPKEIDDYISYEAYGSMQAAEEAAEEYYDSEPCDPSDYKYECYVARDNQSNRDCAPPLDSFRKYVVTAEAQVAFEGSRIRNEN